MPANFQLDPLVQERYIILLLAMVQFINVLEFMIVMPLGPDFAASLGIPTSHIGIIGGSYIAAASFAGIASTMFIERYDRKNALIVAVAGVLIATVLSGISTSFGELITYRVLAGLFGGPATALSLSIVGDLVPPARRGRAMGTVMTSFALASIVGVPLGLELAHLSSWRLPFFAISALGCLVLLGAWFMLPSLTGHLKNGQSSGIAAMLSIMRTLFLTRRNLMCVLLGMSLMSGIFMLIPSVAPYVIANLGYPREGIGFLYFVGGIATFVANVIVGRMVDKMGSFKVATIGTIWYCLTIYLFFIHAIPVQWVTVVLFTTFMMSSAFRSITYQTVLSLVARSSERARFMSLQSSVQHIAGAIGAFLASMILQEGAEGQLLHMNWVAWLSIALAVVAPPLIHMILQDLKKK